MAHVTMQQDYLFSSFGIWQGILCIDPGCALAMTSWQLYSKLYYAVRCCMQLQAQAELEVGVMHDIAKSSML